jgi:Cu(I)/Ag(I) efflux system membrane fusion protein
MRRLQYVIIPVLGIAAGIAASYLNDEWPSARALLVSTLESWYRARSVTEAPKQDRKILYYRNPMGHPDTSPLPKKDSMGMDYIPVYADEEVAEGTPAIGREAPKKDRKILYYRNPMGHPDTSPVPKKDSMGMDYIPVYAVEEGGGSAVKVSLDKIQRTGVRTEAVEKRPVSRPIRGAGTVRHDESRLWAVTVRSDGYIEELFVNKTGQHVRKGEPLFRFYSPQIQLAQADLMVAVRAPGGSTRTSEALEGAKQRLRNLDVPDSRIEEVRKSMTNPRTIDWPSPATGDVIEKRIIEGQRVAAGDELFRIIDHSRVWIIADIAEADIAAVTLGMRATITLRAFRGEPHEGEVTFIYPELMKPETRTVSVRIELPNPDGKMRPGMYADVVLEPGKEDAVIAVPDSAVIDSGTRQVVLVAKGNGRFEPREVNLGRRGEDYTEVTEGLSEGEEVVTSANFLIDAESNLKAALQSFGQEQVSVAR